MAGALLWGWDNTNKVWIPLQVDENGYVKVDISNIKLNDLANVSTGTPDDDDLFYYDNATSLWKSRKLVDADIPAAIARDTEVTSAINTHSGLATGIHGVGASKVCSEAKAILKALLTAQGDIITRNATAPKRLAKGTAGQVLTMGASEPAWAPGGAGAFLTLTDTPASFSGQAGKVPKVNAAEDALEFIDHEFLAKLLTSGANCAMLPVSSGWLESNVNTGSVAQQVMRLLCQTGTTVSSRGMAYAYTFGFQAGGDDFRYINWDKKLYIVFNITISGDNANGTRRVQLKQVNTEGALAAKGLGIRLDNLDLFAESYGTGLASIDLATALTVLKRNQIVIVHDPGVSIKWYVDGVLKGTQSTTANIPSGIGSGNGTLMLSVLNGATALDTTIQIQEPWMWQDA